MPKKDTKDSEALKSIRALLEPDPALIEDILSTQDIWSGKIFQVKTAKVKLPDASFASRELVNNSGGAGVCVVVDHRICLVRQWRVALNKMSLEIPAGKLEYGEDPALCAARELKEEAGLISDRLDLIAASCGAIGFTNECTHIYLAHNVQKTNAAPDVGEFVRVVWLDLDDVLSAVQEGLIQDSKTIIAVFAAVQRGL